jgi:nitric oxide reductase large subunit
MDRRKILGIGLLVMAVLTAVPPFSVRHSSRRDWHFFLDRGGSQSLDVTTLILELLIVALITCALALLVRQKDAE